MLPIIVVALVVAVVKAGVMPPEDKTMQAECAKQVGINLDQANDQLMAAGTDLSKVNALPENVQCFSKCLMTKQGLFGEDGSLVKSEFMKMVSNGDAVIDKAIMQTLESCLDDVTAIDRKSCNFAATITGCMITEFKKINPQ